MGNQLISFTDSILYGTRISELCTGCWGFCRVVIEGLKLDATGFELEANMFAEITKKGYRIAEVPILYRGRPSTSKLLSVKAGFRICRTLVKKRFM